MAARRTRTRSRSKVQREFVSEAEEILERLRAGLADLADRCAGGAEADPGEIHALFRSAHSLKGLAGSFGQGPLRELAHRLEDVLDGMRLGRTPLAAPTLALLDEAVARCADLLRDADASGEPAGADPSDLLRRIDAAVAAGLQEGTPGPEAELDPDLLRTLTEYEEHRLRENMRRGRRILRVQATFEIASFDEGLAELGQALREVGEVLSTLPSPGPAPDRQIRFAVLAATDLEAGRLAARLDLPEEAVAVVWEPRRGAARRPGPAAPPRPPEADEPASLRSLSESVRVDIRKLDELMNLVGELVIQRSAIGAIAQRLSADPLTAPAGAELEKAHKSLDRKIQDLQAGVLDVRMVPLRQVFEKLARVVRRLRHDLRKEVRLELRGADTELDKLLVEELVDPLMHVVRNAFDHAIESPEERGAAGKPAEGCIRVQALQRGNHVVIEVSDDGRGIDLDAVRAEAERRGLVAPHESVGRRELLELIFEPGFSTRSQVTEVSGRGVGMDVVKANLTNLGGVVEVDSRSGHGTTVTLTLPITLAIIPVLLVGVAGQRYAIPLTSVLETRPVAPAEIQRSEGRELLNLRGEALPLRRLAEELALPGSGPEAKASVVVIGLGDARLGLVVERLLGQQDAVLKPIQGPLPAVRGIAGATELGDQEPVLVIDVAALVEDAGRRREAA